MSRDQYRGYRHPFIVGTNYLGGVGDNPRTIVELAMCQFSSKMRREAEWWSSFDCPTFREEWKRYGVEHIWKIRTPSGCVGKVLTLKQVEYVLDELAGYAALRDEALGCQMACFDRIWESNTVVQAETLSLLNNELRYLRETQASRCSRSEDGLNFAVIDPYLHCLVYDRTLVRNANSSTYPQLLPAPGIHDIYTTSQRFAFLPTDFSVSSSGTVKFLSYVNNLDPRNTSLHQHLETTLSAFIPLFDRTLTDLHRNNPLPERIKGAYRYTEWEEPDPPDDSDDDEDWMRYEREVRYWTMHRPIQLPDVPSGGYPGGLERRKYRVSLEGRQLQVVVRVHETRLKPGDLQYVGTPWHVEGMRNERIVACAFYYPSVENIKYNSIQFRMAVTAPRGFSAGDTGATFRTWGLEDGDACHQYVGSVPIQAGLGLVFPNIYQHRETPFRLQDPSKAGHQTVLAFLLVDPEIQPIVSTSIVAPQQREWIMRAVDDFVDVRLPNEVIERIMEHVEGIMTEDEAERFRREMLAERSNFWKLHNSYHFCLPFDVWNQVS